MFISDNTEYHSDGVTFCCYNIVLVPNKRSLHQALGTWLEPGTCIVSNHCDIRSSVLPEIVKNQFS